MSLVLICSFAVIHWVPVIALSRLFPRLRKSVLLLSVCGLYCVWFYLKPAAINLEVFPFLVTLLSAFVLLKKGIKTADFKPDIWLCLIVIYVFSLFIVRREPPSYDDPVKWATLARLLNEYQVVPGDTRPLTQITNLSAATLGVPIQVAISSFFGKLSLERVLFFWSCLSLVLFFELFSVALENWFTKKTARATSLISLFVFTNPQSYITWGGTPTVLGFVGGFVILSLLKVREEKPFHPLESILVGLAISFSAYAHPIGIYVAVLVLVPLLLFEKGIYSKIFGEFFVIAIISLILTVPFLLTNTEPVEQANLLQTRDWQREMAPFLFREKKSVIYNLYTQMTSYLWNTSAVVALCLSVWLAFKKDQRKFFYYFLFGTLLIAIFISNTKWWVFPLSPLIYPERVGTLWVFYLAFGIAVFYDYAQAKKWAKVLGIVLVLFFSIRQFHSRLFPHLKNSLMTESDVRVMEKTFTVVPHEDCIKIDRKWPGAWIPALGFRCTVPSHPLNVNVIHEELNSQPRDLKWVFVSERERATKPDNEWIGERAIDDGALLLKVKE